MQMTFVQYKWKIYNTNQIFYKTKNHPVIVNEIAPPRTSKIKVYLYYLIFCPIIG